MANKQLNVSFQFFLKEKGKKKKGKKKVYQKSDGKDNAPRESEHRNAPIGHAARPFDEDGHNTFAIVGPAANNQDGRDLDNVDDHKPPERTHDVIQMIDDGNTQLFKTKAKQKQNKNKEEFNNKQIYTRGIQVRRGDAVSNERNVAIVFSVKGKTLQLVKVAGIDVTHACRWLYLLRT